MGAGSRRRRAAALPWVGDGVPGTAAARRRRQQPAAPRLPRRGHRAAGRRRRARRLGDQGPDHPCRARGGATAPRRRADRLRLPGALGPQGRRRRLQGPATGQARGSAGAAGRRDRKSTRLNSSHITISYAVFCLKKKKKKNKKQKKKKKKNKEKKKKKKNKKL